MTTPPPCPEGMDRNEGIGSSEVAAVLGFSPYCSPWEVWAEKAGAIPAFDGNEHTEFGTMMEPLIAAKWSAETGLPVRETHSRRSPVEEWAFASPDRLFTHDGEDAILECKWAGSQSAHRWGPSGSTGRGAVPEEYFLQVQWQLWVYGLAHAEIAAFIGDPDFRRYPIKAAPKVQRLMVDKARAWWERHIRDREEPRQMAGTDGEREALSKRFDATTGDLVNGGPEADELVEKYRHAKQQAASWKRLEAARANELRWLIGDAAGVEGPGYRITYKFDKRGIRTMRATFTEE